MTIRKMQGMAEPISLIVVACIIIGAMISIKSKEIDSPAEEAVEAILESQGQHIDFSAHKKSEETKNQELQL